MDNVIEKVITIKSGSEADLNNLNSHLKDGWIVVRVDVLSPNAYTDGQLAYLIARKGSDNE